MFCLFRYKMFFEKCFRYFQCFIGAKIIVNRNNFQFGRKSLFNF
jgi:hypothetical protein